MPENKLSTYTAKTRAYLCSPCGRANFHESQERFGYGYQQALTVAVMVATGLRLYEKIESVVGALMAREAA